MYENFTGTEIIQSCFLGKINMCIFSSAAEFFSHGACQLILLQFLRSPLSTGWISGEVGKNGRRQDRRCRRIRMFDLQHVECDKLEIIEWGVFFSCRSLRHLTLPSVISVGDGAFRSCTRMTDVEFGEGLAMGQVYSMAAALYDALLSHWKPIFLHSMMRRRGTLSLMAVMN